MSTVFIVGAAGKVGRHLVKQLVEREHRVLALHRRAGQGDELSALGATPVPGDLTAIDMDTLARSMAGSDVVVFTAGAGGAGVDVTNAIDGRGLELAVDAARQAGVRRFLLVSAFPEAGRNKAMGEGFENYMTVKKRADVYLAATDLDWVILRPGTLTDTAGTGRVTAGPAIAYGDIPRADVAATLVALVEQPQLRRTIIELTEGDQPVDAAIAALDHA
ncbi:SDR family oxidoreductase [Stenotrophomonas rhizophila]|uniref:SDR family oxidoreductase n=1 Tax=Stenotrophomonas rhizophila TaxID=216778 RepID=UPI00224ABE11|nr:SDR family oxidoreductase [Stenotrophomonas rhizophila]MCX2919548.1 SDR family oxidoreductase [Stenotrophomonas rhizophila]